MVKKNYIYVISESKVNKTYGGVRETANIYELKKNTPIYVDSVSWNTSAYKGADSSVYTKLAEKGFVKSKEYSENRGYYYRSKSDVDIKKLE